MTDGIEFRNWSFFWAPIWENPSRRDSACATSVRVTSPAVNRSRVCRSVTSSTFTLLR